ncbi:MAG: hypothetical protein JW741_00365 [Sedimentisphaerales bacterium]|nr:hypothetical protein [Sedimentisphaerales bacterium]
MGHDKLKRGTFFVACFLMLTGALLGGCRTTRPLQADGLPGEEYLVGGGLMIDWEAPADGTAYLVEKETGKIIETRSLNEGDSYSFSVSSGAQAQEFEEVLGIDFSQARFLLYFKPAPRKE